MEIKQRESTCYEGVLICDQSNRYPTESLLENLDAINIIGVKADERLGFENGGPHHA